MLFYFYLLFVLIYFTDVQVVFFSYKIFTQTLIYQYFFLMILNFLEQLLVLYFVCLRLLSIMYSCCSIYCG